MEHSLRWHQALGIGIATLLVLLAAGCRHPVGIAHLWSAGDGAIAAGQVESDNVWFSYVSEDGGWTWRNAPVDWEWKSTRWDMSTKTPRGYYRIRGNEVLWSPTAYDQAQAVYSPSYLQTSSNIWMQYRLMQEANAGDGKVVFPNLYSIYYEAKSDNVVVAFEHQGVIVGAPDGSWTQVAVGPYAPYPPDVFSFRSKLRQLLKYPALWLTGWAIATAVTAIVIAVFNRYPQSGAEQWQSFLNAAMTIVTWLSSSVFGFMLLTPLIIVLLRHIAPDDWATALAPAMGLVMVTGLSGGIAYLFRDRMDQRFMSSTALALAAFSLALATVAGVLFGAVGELIDLVRAAVIGMALLNGKIVLAMHWRSFRHWTVITIAFLGMNTVMASAFVMWIWTDQAFASKIGAAILLALIGVALQHCLKRWSKLPKTGPSASPPQPSGSQ